MRKNRKIIITMVMTLVLVNASFGNTAKAKENLTIEEPMESQIESITTREIVSQNEHPQETVSRNELQESSTEEKQSGEEMSTKQDPGEKITLEKEMNEETSSDKEQETETIEDNGNPGTFSIQIISDNLPDYVEAVIEKTKVKPFQQALDEFYNQWCDEQEDEYNSEDEDWDEDSDDEDWNDDEDSDDEDDASDDERYVVSYDEEDSDNDDLENEESDGRYLYYNGSNKVLSAYKISFINTKDNSEYQIAEGESVKVKVNNEAYDNSAAGGIMNLEEDGSVEMLQFEQSYDNTTDEQEEEDTADTYDDNAELEEEENTYKETITFDIVHGGKYAILNALTAKATSDSAGYGRAEKENNFKISPKTGVGNSWIAGEAGAFALLMISGYYYQKKKIAKVHKTD